MVNGYLIWNINKTSEMNVVCIPRYCCTLYCENKVNLSNRYKCKVFAKVCRPSSSRCPEGITHYIGGKIISREEFLQKIKEKMKCVTIVLRPFLCLVDEKLSSCILFNFIFLFNSLKPFLNFLIFSSRLLLYSQL